MFDLLVVKAKLEVSTLVFDMQLKRVDFPTFATPTIPHFNAILYKLWRKNTKKETSQDSPI